MTTASKRYGDLATEQQVANAKGEAQASMVSKLEFENFQQRVLEAAAEIARLNNETVDRINGTSNV
ncbi:hypothetical protein CGH11_12820 [Vibrio parahaemolyticus]|uniref:hypothetical protein n=1 Tax=Vibrio parahaemolyticus TaxID=670 RepID=UPI001122E190|nr:hypothetical protein [Vibrio parahaemolyticus]TOP71735.1 hypothetical protein CGH11_12820 [Vibrio parahaemolyticus]